MPTAALWLLSSTIIIADSFSPNSNLIPFPNTDRQDCYRWKGFVADFLIHSHSANTKFPRCYRIGASLSPSVCKARAIWATPAQLLQPLCWAFAPLLARRRDLRLQRRAERGQRLGRAALALVRLKLFSTRPFRLISGI
jgi:hypothetical protein